jgi:hypothetical protein
MTTFKQWVNTKRIYHIDLESVDGSDFPVHSQLIWTVTHYSADGSPSAHSIGVIETAPDCHTARITTGHLLGAIVVRVTAAVSPTAVATQTFTIEVAAHPPVLGRAPTFKISQCRNGPIH